MEIQRSALPKPFTVDDSMRRLLLNPLLECSLLDPYLGRTCLLALRNEAEALASDILISVVYSEKALASRSDIGQPAIVLMGVLDVAKAVKRRAENVLPLPQTNKTHSQSTVGCTGFLCPSQ